MIWAQAAQRPTVTGIICKAGPWQMVSAIRQGGDVCPLLASINPALNDEELALQSVFIT